MSEDTMKTSEPETVKLLDQTQGYGRIKNLLGVADPDVHKIAGRWWMFLGGFQPTFKNNLFSLSLPPNAPLNSREWSFTTSESDPRRALPLIEQPREGGFDAYGLHTPSYVRGVVKNVSGDMAEVERVYYAGRSAKTVTGNSKPYSIGFLERSSSGWVRHPTPILTGTPESPSVLEPKARYLEGKWRIWYVTTPQEQPRGEVPQYRIEYVESSDGISGWSVPKELFSTTEGYFDCVVTKAPDRDRYEMVVCRGSNLHDVPGTPPQGLWWLESKTLSSDRNDWTRKPTLILDADGGEPWYGNGMFGPSIHSGDTPEDADTLYVFFSGTYRKLNWPRLAAERLLALKRPPFPAPYYFAVGRTRFKP